MLLLSLLRCCTRVSANQSSESSGVVLMSCLLHVSYSMYVWGSQYCQYTRVGMRGCVLRYSAQGSIITYCRYTCYRHTEHRYCQNRVDIHKQIPDSSLLKMRIGLIIGGAIAYRYVFLVANRARKHLRIPIALKNRLALISAISYCAWDRYLKLSIDIILHTPDTEDTRPDNYSVNRRSAI